MSTSSTVQGVLFRDGQGDCLSKIRTVQQISGELSTVIFQDMLGNRKTPSKLQSCGHYEKTAAKKCKPVPHGDGFLKIDEASKERPASTGGNHNATIETRHKVRNSDGFQPGVSGLGGREQDLVTG